ncbi:hypothetical protein GCM10027290_06290 [Micromonospora sonneratiae]
MRELERRQHAVVVQPAQQHTVTAGQLGLDPKDWIIHRLAPPSRVGNASPRGETRDQAGSVAGQADVADSRPDLRCERQHGVGSGVRLKTDVNADAKPDPRTGIKPELVTANAYGSR